jgi:hypothetical protein
MNINIKYPTHLQEIPLSAYQKWLKVEETTNDEEILAFKFVSIFCGLEMKTVSRMSVKDVHFIINKIKEVLNQKPEFHKRWKYNGVEFGLIPDLENMSFGEYIDVESHLTKWDGLHKAFAVLYRPITNTLKDTYTIAEYKPNEKYMEIMQNLPLNIVLGTSLFFLNLESELLNNLTLYLKKQTRKTKKTNIVNGRSLPSRGIGTIAFTDLAAEISKELIASPIVPYLKPLPSFRTLRKKTKSKPTSAKDKLEKQKIKV